MAKSTYGSEAPSSMKRADERHVMLIFLVVEAQSRGLPVPFDLLERVYGKEYAESYTKWRTAPKRRSRKTKPSKK